MLRIQLALNKKLYYDIINIIVLHVFGVLPLALCKPSCSVRAAVTTACGIGAKPSARARISIAPTWQSTEAKVALCRAAGAQFRDEYRVCWRRKHTLPKISG